LSLLCAEAKEDGWAQVTASTLQPRADVESNICEFKPWCVAPPEYFTAEAIFRHLFTGVISRLVQDMNASFKQRHQGPRDTKVRTTEHQMWALVAVLIRVMAEQKRLLKETVRDKDSLHGTSCQFMSLNAYLALWLRRMSSSSQHSITVWLPPCRLQVCHASTN